VPMDSDSPDRYILGVMSRLVSRFKRTYETTETWDAEASGRGGAPRAESLRSPCLPAIARPGWLLLFAATYISGYRFPAPRSDREPLGPTLSWRIWQPVGPSNRPTDRPTRHTDSTVATPRNTKHARGVTLLRVFSI